MASVARWCCCEAVEPCVDCLVPVFSPTNTPNNATVNGVTENGWGSCNTLNAVYTFNSYFKSGTTSCTWTWDEPNLTGSFTLTYYLTATTTICGLTPAAGDWHVGIGVPGIFQTRELTTGFSCDATTKKVSGTHAFAAGPACGLNGCAGTPSVTVPA